MTDSELSPFVGFGGGVRPVYDSERGKRIAFACHGTALHRPRFGPLQLPGDVDAQAGLSLQGGLARVLGAWREAFA